MDARGDIAGRRSSMIGKAENGAKTCKNTFFEDFGDFRFFGLFWLLGSVFGVPGLSGESGNARKAPKPSNSDSSHPKTYECVYYTWYI